MHQQRLKYKQPKHTTLCEKIRDFYSHFRGGIDSHQRIQETKSNKNQKVIKPLVSFLLRNLLTLKQITNGNKQQPYHRS